MAKLSKVFFWSGVILILVVGLIHVIDAKDSFSDAVYKGWLFYANGAVAIISACGIYRKHFWGWNFGLMIAVGSFGGYVASRTVGLPFIPAEPDAWFEPLGVAAMIAEVLFVVVFIGKRVLKL
jgi:uncharacterized membrane protein HdeD (DUF308 family)